VNHDILMAQVSRVVKDKRMLQLIGRFLRVGIVLPDGSKSSSTEGTPQGGPLCFAALTPAGQPAAGYLTAFGSPLLANIYLDKLDKEIESRGLQHVRYADDCNIYVSSERAAKRVMTVMSQWIAKHLKLQVNAEKSGTGRVWERKLTALRPTGSSFLAVCLTSFGSWASSSPLHCSSPHPRKRSPSLKTR
jgi:RNA-directed DNA polymerase